eukprot:TRINITY_DN47736_c0_g1_i1.p1 TRINITY_DN47736_c0_g1~~TRINITY_DN47736_c0_g1_i1.p1  ORF type:complete len:441 (-),score=84.21 TRINITY_DN47736_c0_g1_i1:147-1469(-)
MAHLQLAGIAKHFGKEEAVATLNEASANEEARDFEQAIKLYRRAYKLWDALDSTLDEGGLPLAVRAAAEAAGLACEVQCEGPMSDQTSPRFEVEATEQWLAHLDEHGYCVIADVADAKDIERAKLLMWEFLESAPESKVSRGDPSTWDKCCGWLPSSGNGIIGSNGFGQSDFCWHARLLPKVKQAFASLWGCSDLLVSFDGGNVFRPWTQRPEWRTQGSWWHIDQNFFMPGKVTRVSVQGLLTFTDATPRTGGLCVVPGSHQQFREVCERSCAQKLPRNFVPVQPGDPVIALGTRLVCAKAGDLVLWDSRCVHCNTPGILEAETAKNSCESCADDLMSSSENMSAATTVSSAESSADPMPELLRVVSYVCMAPAAWASDDVVSRRKDAFIKNVTANHWPYELHGDHLVPSWPARRKWNHASDTQKHLIVGMSSPLLADEE